MIAVLGTMIFGGALLLVAQIFLDSLVPALPRIAALLGAGRAHAPARARERVRVRRVAFAR